MASKNPFYVFLSLISISRVMMSTSAQSDTYIVHMDTSVMPKAFSGYHSWYSATVESLLQNSNPSFSSPKLIYSYTHVIQGFSATLSPSDLEALKNSPGYISSIEDLPVKADTTHTSQFLGLNSKSGAWPASNYGRDVIIGLVDTGVWPESESFSDNGMSEIPKKWKGACEIGTQFNSSMCNKKLIGARFFNKGLIAKNPNITISMNSTRDIDGHGTHTSTTAAGNYVSRASYFGYAPGVASGMAPKAHVAMYKALWEEGAYTSDIIAAIDQAIKDGVDVISISLGLDGVSLDEDPIAIATFAAIEKGIFVSTSAGNEGPYYGSLHNGTPWVLTVGAGTIDREFSGVVVLDNGVTLTGSSLYPGNSSLSNRPIVFMDACNNSKELKKVGNKIVVCLDKNETLNDQVDNIRNAMVAGGVFISNNTMDFEFFIQSSFPATFLDPKNGEIIIDYIKNSKNSEPKASIEFQKTILGKNLSPTVAGYSSRGPSPSCPSVLKPDIMGPGSLILAAWPQNNSVTDVNSKPVFSNFNLLSGTSMSCPHLAGVAALLKAVHPEWSPAAIRSAMMTTSDSMDNTNSPIKDMGYDNKFATPLAMGAGHINPNKALDPGLIYNASFQDYVNLLCALNFNSTQIKIITRTSSYNCSNPSSDLNYPSFIAFFNTNDSNSDKKIVREFRRTLTYMGEGMSTYIANVTPMKGVKVSVVPEKLVFKQKYEMLSFKLSLEGPRLLKEVVDFGYLSWVESEGKHVVKSPIVATRLSSKIL